MLLFQGKGFSIVIVINITKQRIVVACRNLSASLRCSKAKDC
jgi:hypothetical protein